MTVRVGSYGQSSEPTDDDQGAQMMQVLGVFDGQVRGWNLPAPFEIGNFNMTSTEVDLEDLPITVRRS